MSFYKQGIYAYKLYVGYIENKFIPATIYLNNTVFSFFSNKNV